MKFRKNRLVLLGAIGILVKLMKEERQRFLSGDTTSGKFRWNSDSKAPVKDVTPVEPVETFTFTPERFKKDVLGNEVTILSTDYLDSADGIEASPGMDLIRLRVSFKGNTEGGVTVSKDNFSLESENGHERKYDEGSYFDRHLVNKGETVEGTLLFEVPERIRNLTLKFTVGNALSETGIRFR